MIDFATRGWTIRRAGGLCDANRTLKGQQPRNATMEMKGWPSTWQDACCELVTWITCPRYLCATLVRGKQLRLTTHSNNLNTRTLTPARPSQLDDGDEGRSTFVPPVPKPATQLDGSPPHNSTSRATCDESRHAGAQLRRRGGYDFVAGTDPVATASRSFPSCVSSLTFCLVTSSTL